jgi:hypothetical protein
VLDEDEVQYQSAGKYHKERFQHLTMLHEHWTHQVGLLLAYLKKLCCWKPGLSCLSCAVGGF